MATIQASPANGKRKHHPELLRFKRAARALNMDWGDVTRERDRLRKNELDERAFGDSLHRAATVWFGGEGAAPFWRGFFRRKFGKLIRDGGDHTKIKGFDLFVQAQGRCGPVHCMSDEASMNYDPSGFSVDDAWEILISDRPPLTPIWDHYEHAICRLAAAKLPSGDELADDGTDSEVPF